MLHSVFKTTYPLLFEESVERYAAKTVNTLEADAPATKIAIPRRTLSAGNFVPGIVAWLCHVDFGLGHLGFEQVLVTTASVPT